MQAKQQTQIYILISLPHFEVKWFGGLHFSTYLYAFKFSEVFG